jgi:hypothetical protein
MKEFTNKSSLTEAAASVLSKGASSNDIVEAKQSFTDLKRPVQDSILKIFQMYDNSSLTTSQKDGLAAVFKYGLEFSNFAQQQTIRQTR